MTKILLFTILATAFTASNAMQLEQCQKNADLFLAVVNNRVDEVKKLLTDGANHTMQDIHYGNALLHEAASIGAAEIINLLLAAGAEIDIKDYGGNTPLHEAARKGSLNAVQILLDGCADSNAENSDGKTPLNLAIENNKTEVINALRAFDKKRDAGAKENKCSIQ